jgi:hypothetical protein
MTPKLLKQTTSGELYVWTPELAKRDDMVEVEPAAPVKKVDAPLEPVQTEQVEEGTTEVKEVKPAPKKKGK